MGALCSCSDFEDVNTNPSALDETMLHPDYMLNSSFYQAQMDPDIAERVFIYNWASISRIVGDNTYGVSGRYSDEYNGRLYSYSSTWINYATRAIELADSVEPDTEHEQGFFQNVKQIARIWRTMLIADFTDSFGPYPLDAFQGYNPTFNGVDEVYDFLLAELTEAAAAIDPDVEPTDTEALGDPAFGYDGAKWIKLANSLRLRYAMRLSEVDPSTAKSEFEAAAAEGLDNLITTLDDMFAFQEYGGWSCYEGVYNRSWSDHCLSSTMCNLLSGLGGIPVTEYRPDLADYIKPMTYIGEEYVNHYPETTDNPMKLMWMDGIPENLDPRALVIWCLPNDSGASNFPSSQGAQGVANHAAWGMLNPDNTEEVLVSVDAQFCWNGALVGTRTAWSANKFALNRVIYNCWDTTPMLGQQYRDNSLKRIWMSPWEVEFLLAEAGTYGWSIPTTAQDAYEEGIALSFEYHGVSEYLDRYLASEDYNRVGTSVSFTHTAEPENFTADYVDGYTKEAKQKTYEYPTASKTLYGKALNDQLSKIITQKYLANVPYGAVESWNDRRRLGLPFFEIMANESEMTGSDMQSYIDVNAWDQGQKWYHYVQRMRYYTGLETSDAEGYQQALQLLGGDNTMMVPLYWAIGD